MFLCLLLCCLHVLPGEAIAWHSLQNFVQFKVQPILQYTFIFSFKACEDIKGERNFRIYFGFHSLCICQLCHRWSHSTNGPHFSCAYQESKRLDNVSLLDTVNACADISVSPGFYRRPLNILFLVPSVIYSFHQ